MVTYQPAAIRGLIDTLIEHVFNEPIPRGTLCAQEWRERRLRKVIAEFLADDPGPIDGSMPWHAIAGHVLELDEKRRELLHEHGPHVARQLAAREIRQKDEG